MIQSKTNYNKRTELFIPSQLRWREYNKGPMQNFFVNLTYTNQTSVYSEHKVGPKEVRFRQV
jgi:hypothetical protein